jgi:hypothetical protein
MKLSTFPFLVVLALCAASGRVLAAGSMVDLEIVDRNTGQQLQVYSHLGRYFVVGTPGNRYAIRIRNVRGERLLAVVSVDGINVISGATAALNQTGYVLGPHGSTEINGWRKDLNQIAAFVFANEAESYAARTGRPANVGVVGVAVFSEKKRPIRWREDRIAPGAKADEGSGASSKPRSYGKRAPQQTEQSHLGTGHGEREQSLADYTNFTRARNTPDELIAIRYDSYRNLVAMGVIPHRLPDSQPNPNPFPGNFVPDPH